MQVGGVFVVHAVQAWPRAEIDCVSVALQSARVQERVTLPIVVQVGMAFVVHAVQAWSRAGIHTWSSASVFPPSES